MEFWTNLIVHSNTHTAEQLYAEWFLSSSSKDLGHVMKHTKYMLYYHIISVKPTTVVKSYWWLLMVTLPPALWKRRHSEKQNKKKKSVWNYLLLKYAIIPKIMCAPYLEHTHFRFRTEILFFSWDTANSSLQPLLNPSVLCIHTNLQVSCETLLVSQHLTMNVETSFIY